MGPPQKSQLVSRRQDGPSRDARRPYSGRHITLSIRIPSLLPRQFKRFFRYLGAQPIEQLRPGAEFSARRATRRTLASIHPIHSRSGRTPRLSDRFSARRGRRAGEQAACLSGAPAPGSTHLRLPFPRLFPWLVVRPLLSPAVIPFGKLALLVVAMFGGTRVGHSARRAPLEGR